jgi:hypothetical protein
LESFHNLSNMLLVLFPHVRVYDYVIQIDYHTGI